MCCVCAPLFVQPEAREKKERKKEGRKTGGGGEAWARAAFWSRFGLVVLVTRPTQRPYSVCVRVVSHLSWAPVYTLFGRTVSLLSCAPVYTLFGRIASFLSCCASVYTLSGRIASLLSCCAPVYTLFGRIISLNVARRRRRRPAQIITKPSTRRSAHTQEEAEPNVCVNDNTLQHSKTA